MEYLRKFAVVAVAAMASMLLIVSMASATALEVGGTPKSTSVEITASLKTGTSLVLRTTGGLFANTCTASHVKGSTASPYSSTTVGGPLSSLSFSGCSEEKVVVDEAGSLTVEWTSGTNGTVRSSGAKVTVPSPFGKLICVTGAGAGTDIGTLTGVKESHATLDINAVINCGIIPSAVWEGTYTVTSPTGLGVTAEATTTTTLEVGASAKSESVEITASLKAGTAETWTTTGEGPLNACTGSHVGGSTESPYSGSEVGGPLSSLSFSKCSEEPIEVKAAGRLNVEYLPGTTNGTVSSEEAEIQVPSPLGSLTCKTGAGTDIGTLTGVVSGQATIDINGILNCGLVPSAAWKGTYTVTSPTGLGVTDEAVSTTTTTLEVAGTPRHESVEITASLNSGTSLVLRTTGGLFANTCTASHVKVSTESPYSAGRVGGALSSLSFSKCSEEKVEVDEPGSLSVERIGSTTNGTVRSTGAKVTVPSPFGKLTCVTPAVGGTDIGTLTGAKEGHATLDINAVINCGIIPSALWQGTYTVTSPTGLGVTG